MAGGKRELKVEISGDSTGARKALGGVDDATEKTQSRLGRAGAFMQNALDKVGLGGSKASTAIGGVGDALGGAINPATAATAAIGAVVGVAAKGIGDFVNLADQVRTFKQLSGATAEESSKFVAVLDDFDISAETGANAMFKLGRSVGPNAQALKEMGVEVAKNADGSVNLTETTLNVADAYARTTDPAKRAELVTKAFGKSGADLIPVLEQGRKGLDEFFKGAEGNHQLLSDEDLAKAREYELAMDALGDATSGLSREIGQVAAPAVADFATAIAELITAADELGGKLNVGGVLGGAIKDTAYLIGGPIGSFAAFKDKLGEVTGASEDTAESAEELTEQNEQLQEATEDAADAQRDAAKAAAEQEKALNSLLTAQMGLIDADIRLEETTRKVEQAKQAAAEAFAVASAAAGKDMQANSDNETAVQNLKQAILDQAQAVVNKAKIDEEAKGRTLEQADANRIFKDRLLEVAGTLAPGNALRAELEGYAAQLQSLPEAKQTLLTAESSSAMETFRAMERELTSRPITVPVQFDVRADILQMDIERSARNITTTRAFQDAVTNAVQTYLQRGGRFV